MAGSPPQWAPPKRASPSASDPLIPAEAPFCLAPRRRAPRQHIAGPLVPIPFLSQGPPNGTPRKLKGMMVLPVVLPKLPRPYGRCVSQGARVLRQGLRQQGPHRRPLFGRTPWMRLVRQPFLYRPPFSFLIPLYPIPDRLTGHPQTLGHLPDPFPCLNHSRACARFTIRAFRSFLSSPFKAWRSFSVRVTSDRLPVSTALL